MADFGQSEYTTRKPFEKQWENVTFVFLIFHKTRKVKAVTFFPVKIGNLKGGFSDSP